MNEADAIDAVLGGFVPVGDDHPKAQETFESVKELVAARAPERRVGPRDELIDRLLAENKRLRAEINELRESHV